MNENKVLKGEVVENIPDKEEKKTGQGYKYGKFKPGKKKDNGEYLKKPGVKKGTIRINDATKAIDIGKVLNRETFGKKKIEDHRALAAGAKAGKPLTREQAIYELGITPQTFYKRLRGNEELKLMFEEAKEARRDHMRELAESNIEKGLSGQMGLTGKEQTDLSLKILEKTDKAYQPKTEIEQKTLSINIHKSTDDIMGELASILGVNLNQDG